MNDVRVYFNERSRAYQRGGWKSHGLFPQELAAIDQLPSDLAVAIDLGSGPGAAARALAARVRSVLCVDISEGMLNLRNHSLPVVLADGLSMPMRTRVADVVMLRMSMHYFETQRLSAELSRILKRPGTLIISAIFPYGLDDCDWFNERNRFKNKPGVQKVLPVAATVEALADRFDLLAKEEWASVTSLGESVVTNPHGNAEKLRSHLLDASALVKSLYGVTSRPNGTTELRSKWAVLTLGTR
jgi:ubiquinone/menaquinone biosynthesis C-methylase UbiE